MREVLRLRVNWERVARFHYRSLCDTEIMNLKKKILIVEDEATIARGLSDLLCSEGYVTVVATHGLQATRKVLQMKPDLVLLDLNLPGIGGLEVCRQIRSGGF